VTNFFDKIGLKLNKINKEDKEIGTSSSNDSGLTEASISPDSYFNKPLGDIGDMTLNEAILRVKQLNFPFDNVQVVLEPFKFIPTALVYKQVVKTFANYFHPMSEAPSPQFKKERAHYLHRRRLGIASFMIGAAPIITSSLIFFVQKSYSIS
jgi:hypothetical protein